MKPNNPYRKRQEVFADREIKNSLFRRLLLHWLVFAGTVVSLNALLIMAFEDPQYSLSETLWKAFLLQTPIMVAIGVLIPIFIRDALKISNRFAGPMVRLRRSLKSLANGEKVPPLVFRENDYWLDSATEFNRVRQLVIGLYKDLDITDGLKGSEQLAIAANMSLEDSNPNAKNRSDSSTKNSSTPGSSLSSENRVIWQGERNHKPSRYVHDESAVTAPIYEPLSTEIPIQVSAR